MIQLAIYAAIVAALVGGAVYGVHTIKESGREECRAEHQEAARMAELRSRERVTTARTQLGNTRTQIKNRDNEARKAVAGADRSCIDDRVRDALNERIRQGRTGAGIDKPVFSPKGD